MARFNPIDYAVKAVRTLVITGYEWPTILSGALVLGLFACLGVTLATLTFRKMGD